MSPFHDQELTPSTAYIEYSIHWAQHSLSTAYTAYCILPRSTVSCSQPVSSLGRSCCTQFSTFAQLRVDQWIESPLPSRLLPEHTASRLTAFQYFSNLARSRPPSASPNSVDHGLKCMSKLIRWRHPSASPNPLERGLLLHLQSRSITASKCISKLAQSRPPSASPNSLNHGLQVHLQNCSIAASKCIPELTRSSFSGAPRSWAR